MEDLVIKKIYKHDEDVLNCILNNKKFVSDIIAPICFSDRIHEKSDEKCVIVKMAEFDTGNLKFYRSKSKRIYEKSLKSLKNSINNSPRYYEIMRKIFKLYDEYIIQHPNFEKYETICDIMKEQYISIMNEKGINELNGYDEEIMDMIHCNDFYDTSMDEKEISEFVYENQKRLSLTL